MILIFNPSNLSTAIHWMRSVQFVIASPKMAMINHYTCGPDIAILTYANNAPKSDFVR